MITFLPDSRTQTENSLINFFATMMKLHPSKGRAINYFLIMAPERIYGRLELPEEEEGEPEVHLVKLPVSRSLGYPQVIQLTEEDILSKRYDIKA